MSHSLWPGIPNSCCSGASSSQVADVMGWFPTISWIIGHAKFTSSSETQVSKTNTSPRSGGPMASQRSQVQSWTQELGELENKKNILWSSNRGGTQVGKIWLLWKRNLISTEFILPYSCKETAPASSYCHRQSVKLCSQRQVWLWYDPW